MSNSVNDNMHSIEVYLKKIDLNNYLIAKKREDIDEKIIEFTNFINTLREDICRYSQEINRIKSKTVKANLADIIYSYSRTIGINPSDISIECITDFKGINTAPFFADQLVEKFNKSKDTSSDELGFCIIIKTPLDKPITLRSTLRLDEIQRSGKVLGQHIEAFKRENNNRYTTDIKINDINDLILNFTLGELIKQTPQGMNEKDNISKAILEAAKVYSSIQENVEEHNIT